MSPLATLHAEVREISTRLRDIAARSDVVTTAPSLGSAFQALAEAGFHLSVLACAARQPSHDQLTPGGYLADCRTVAGLSVEDVAQRLATEPRIPERDRAELLRAIEADISSPTIVTLAALRAIFRFDIAVLARLAAPAPDFDLVIAA